MQTIVQGKEIETTYSVKAVRGENGKLTKKPELVKERKLIKWTDLKGIPVIDGEVRYNQNDLYISMFKRLNISKDEEVSIVGQVYRADIDTLMLHTDKVVNEVSINQSESETEYTRMIAEYNQTIIDCNEQMAAYCKLNNVDINKEDIIDDLKKILGINDCHYGTRDISNDGGFAYGKGYMIKDTSLCGLVLNPSTTSNSQQLINQINNLNINN